MFHPRYPHPLYGPFAGSGRLSSAHRARPRVLLVIAAMCAALAIPAAGCQLKIGPDVKFTPGGVNTGTQTVNATNRRRAELLYDRAYLFAAAFRNADARKIYRMLTVSARHKTSPAAIRKFILREYSGVEGIATFKIDRNTLRVNGNVGRALVVFTQENGYTGKRHTVWRWVNGRWYLDAGY